VKNCSCFVPRLFLKNFHGKEKSGQEGHQESWQEKEVTSVASFYPKPPALRSRRFLWVGFVRPKSSEARRAKEDQISAAENLTAISAENFRGIATVPRTRELAMTSRARRSQCASRRSVGACMQAIWCERTAGRSRIPSSACKQAAAWGRVSLERLIRPWTQARDQRSASGRNFRQ
jgi:hypothetical protein